MPDCGVHCLWFAFVCFLIRSHTPPAPCPVSPHPPGSHLHVLLAGHHTVPAIGGGCCRRPAPAPHNCLGYGGVVAGLQGGFPDTPLPTDAVTQDGGGLQHDPRHDRPYGCLLAPADGRAVAAGQRVFRGPAGARAPSVGDMGRGRGAGGRACGR